jgi:protein translocase SecG subunit
MTYIAGILTFMLVVNCALLILLVLAQVPKKDSGAGLAFGGGAADALFGAGSGNALTKVTKWAMFAFVVITVLLGCMEVKMHNGNSSAFSQGVEQQQQQAEQPRLVAPPSSTPSSPSATPSSGQQPPAMSLFSATNAPAPSAATTTTNGK